MTYKIVCYFLMSQTDATWQRFLAQSPIYCVHLLQSKFIKTYIQLTNSAIFPANLNIINDIRKFSGRERTEKHHYIHNIKLDIHEFFLLSFQHLIKNTIKEIVYVVFTFICKNMLYQI